MKIWDRMQVRIGTIELQTIGITRYANGQEERLDGIPIEQLNEIQQLSTNQVRKISGSPGIAHDVGTLDTATNTLSAILVEIQEVSPFYLNNKLLYFYPYSKATI